MKPILSFGKYLFALPFAIFGVMHLLNAGAMAAMAPFGGAAIIYLTGLALLAAAISIVIGKMDKLATALLGLMLLLFALLIHANGLANATDEMASATSMSNMLKDLALAGAAWVYSANAAKDPSYIG